MVYILLTLIASFGSCSLAASQSKFTFLTGLLVITVDAA